MALISRLMLLSMTKLPEFDKQIDERASFRNRKSNSTPEKTKFSLGGWLLHERRLLPAGFAGAPGMELQKDQSLFLSSIISVYEVGIICTARASLYVAE
jgi:hypothetical protein